MDVRNVDKSLEYLIIDMLLIILTRICMLKQHISKPSANGEKKGLETVLIKQILIMSALYLCVHAYFQQGSVFSYGLAQDHLNAPLRRRGKGLEDITSMHKNSEGEEK